LRQAFGLSLSRNDPLTLKLITRIGRSSTRRFLKTRPRPLP
jgi:hypothetical protein